MATATTTQWDQIARSLQLAAKQVARTAELLDEGNTVPFITRYRKDQTGGLDEVQVRAVQEELGRMRQLAERKETILRSIEAQGKLTPELRTKIEAAKSTKALEDLYLPFKPKKQTLATQARERGLGPLADEILSGAEAASDLPSRALALIDKEKGLNTLEEVLAGVGHIIAETFSERADLRHALRRIYRKTAQLVSSGQKSTDENKEEKAESAESTADSEKEQKPKNQSKADKKKAQDEKLRQAFRDYFEFRQRATQVPPHRVLAINRGERKKILKVKVEADAAALQRETERLLLSEDHPHREFLEQCAVDALSRLIQPSLERELRRELTEKAEAHAAEVFAKNLRNLLLQPPVHHRRVLAVDPGFRSGAKLVALDEFGSPLANDLVHVVGSDERLAEARRKIVDMIQTHKLNVVAIGNGTACRETEKLVGEIIAVELKDSDIGYAVVNEAGASVYSTSQLGRDEFPDYDATVRGAVSIGRRLLDPLSELVKIDPASIGVGLYQHDVKAKHLRESLDTVVESCVNFVGVDVNAASPALLRYVSGLNQLTAQRIFEHRKEHGPFKSRQQLLDVSGLGEAKFVQAAGFLKITDGDNPLDASWIHPESYEVATNVLDRLGMTVEELGVCKAKPAEEEVLDDAEAANKDSGAPAVASDKLADIDRDKLAAELSIGPMLLGDILNDLMRPGRDPREDLPPPIFRQEVLKLEDLEPGMELAGTVLNVIDFGAFVDIGLHDSALVHISQLGTKFVRDPHEVVSVGDVVKVWVLSTDKERRRVALTMIPPGAERERPPKKEARPKRRGEDSSKGRPPRRRRDGNAKSSGGRGRSQTARKPKPKPKPVVPLTEEMKKGAEPLRSFGDLAQFVELKKDEDERKETDESES